MSKEETKRILNLHIDRSKNHYLNNQVILETKTNKDVKVGDFQLKVIDGKMKVTNTKTKKSLIYSLETNIVGFRKTINIDSIDSNNITISVGFSTQTEPMDLEVLSKLLMNNFGSKEIKHETKKGKILYFVL